MAPSYERGKSEATLYGARSHASKVSDARVCEYVRTRARMRRWVAATLGLDEGDIDVEEFGKSLRNGIVLCYLMNELSPRSVPRIQEKTSADFQLKENVIFFLAAIRDFGVPRHRWFSLPDLLEGASTVNVVECLSSLAEVARAKDIECAKVEEIEVGSDEAILQTLSKKQLARLRGELGRLRAENTGGRVVKIAPAIMRRKLALLTGGDKKKLRTAERGITLVQAIFRGFKARELYHSMKRDIAYRQDVSREIFETERSYAESLGLLIDAFLVPLRTTHSKLLSPNQLELIFGDIEQIQGFAVVLAEELRPVVEDWHTNNRLGGIFLKLMDFLKIYARYVQGFETAIETILVAQKKSKKFDKFLTDQRVEHAKALKSRDLADFLIMPVQRVPRYEMLLGDLAKHTWVSHPDHEDLHEAERRMHEIGQHLNESKRSAENKTALLGLQRALGKKGSGKLKIAQPGRSLIYHAGAQVAVGGQSLEPKKGKYPKLKSESLHIYILSDILLLTKGDVSRDSKVTYRGHWPIDAIVARDADTPEDAQAAWKVADKGYIEVKQKEVLFRILCGRRLERSAWTQRLSAGAAAEKSTVALMVSDADDNSSVVSVGESDNATAEEKLKRRRLTSVGSSSPVSERVNNVKEDSKAMSHRRAASADMSGQRGMAVGDSRRPRGKKKSGVGRLLTLRSSKAKREKRRSLDASKLREVQDEMASDNTQKQSVTDARKNVKPVGGDSGGSVDIRPPKVNIYDGPDDSSENNPAPSPLGGAGGIGAAAGGGARTCSNCGTQGQYENSPHALHPTSCFFLLT